MPVKGQLIISLFIPFEIKTFIINYNFRIFNMKKRILALAILSTLTTLVHADDISFVQGTTEGSTIDMYQVPFKGEDGDVAIINEGSDTIVLSSGTNTQMNILTGTETGGQNTITIDQSASTTSIANLAVNAQVVDGDEVLNDVGAGNYVTGRIEDITASIDGIKGQKTTDDTTLNTVSITQSGESDMASVAVAGSSNTISLEQSGLADKAFILVDGSNNTVTVAQANDNATYNLALHTNDSTITVNQ